MVHAVQHALLAAGSRVTRNEAMIKTNPSADNNNKNSNNDEAEYMEIISNLTSCLLENGYPIHGTDTDDNTYESVDEMWRVQGIAPVKNGAASGSSSWYKSALHYWDDSITTIDGMLGGFAAISPTDLDGSRAFLTQVVKDHRPRLRLDRCCDVGAGIGRVTKGFLLSFGFKQCDMVEASSRQLEVAPTFVGEEYVSQCRFFCSGLQDWIPPKTNCYDLIWIQWVISYLTDVDCVRFLRRCTDALREGDDCDTASSGIICFKENTCDDKAFVVDNDDSSLTRSTPYLINLAEQAGLDVIHIEYQNGFPKELFAVPMIAFEKRRQKKL